MQRQPGSSFHSAPARIRVGIGGWSFAPWRDNFYPRGLTHAQELSYASRKVSAIEINATFYRTQSPESFRRWAGEAPDGFVFSVKAHRLTTHRKRLAESGPSIDHFLSSGVLELGTKLGPLLWQFAPTKKFEPDDFEAFLAALPREAGGIKLRHVVEVRHESFCDKDFVALARRQACAICLADSDKYPMIADIGADFVYVRLQRSAAALEAGYPATEIDAWAKRARLWAKGMQPEDLPYLAEPAAALPEGRDSFIFFVAGAKERNPAAGRALIGRLEPDKETA
ncbi:DUF72 domain-containing protein [Methylocapsa aurea]|uniref:DUF72 domain-containing protein n=1 Tax=Methylocapsa aurea TaxID=663610 RepID=UPI000AEA510F|nr:DUF72 domain-containing protein [Methylocapsa aurea]